MIYILIISIVANVGLIFLLSRAIFRLFQFDSLFTFLLDDFYLILQALNKLTKNHLVSSSPEVIAVHRTFLDAIKKIDHYTTILSSARNIASISDKKPTSTPPSIIE